MASRKGSLLEQLVANIFKSLGFYTETNVKKKGYEIDVFVKKGNFEIIIECKQYENSSLTLRNLIHQWADKNSEIKADKVILVLYGINIKEADRNLASSRNIILWDEKTLQRYIDLTIKNKEEALKKLITELNLSIEDEKTRNLINIFKKLIILTMMSEHVDEEDIYASFIINLKTYIQTSIKSDADKKFKLNKKDYAELFSRVEMTGQSNKEKWMRIKEIIENDNKLFPERRVKEFHLEILRKIENSFKEGKKFFEEQDKKKLRYKLIKTALEMIKSFLLNALCITSKQNKKHKIYVGFRDDKFYFMIDKNVLSHDKIEKLEWLIDEPKMNTSLEILDLSKSIEDENRLQKIETIIWSLDDDIDKAIEYVEELFREIFEEMEDFDILLDGPYNFYINLDELIDGLTYEIFNLYKCDKTLVKQEISMWRMDE